ncbi:putative reverse transcriptase domain-containing protein [Tanacetum coccineum]
MDQKLCTYAERQTDNKRKADDSSRNNHGHQQQPFKRQNVAKVYNMGSGEKKPYGGSLPKCTKCHFHHNGPCTQKCHKCNKVGHFARDCRGSGNANVANAQKDNRAVPKGNGYLECGGSKLQVIQVSLSKFKDKDGEMGMHKVGYTQLEMQKRMGMHRGTRTLMSSRKVSRSVIVEYRFDHISVQRLQEYMAKGMSDLFGPNILTKKKRGQVEGKHLRSTNRSRFFKSVSRGLAGSSSSSTGGIPDRLDSRSRARSSSTVSIGTSRDGGISENCRALTQRLP